VSRHENFHSREQRHIHAPRTSAPHAHLAPSRTPFRSRLTSAPHALEVHESYLARCLRYFNLVAAFCATCVDMTRSISSTLLQNADPTIPNTQHAGYSGANATDAPRANCRPVRVAWLKGGGGVTMRPEVRVAAHRQGSNQV
jgi:hypothetical protein